MLEKLAHFIATGFFSGYAPAASGTAGSIVAAVLAYFLWHAFPELASVVPSTALACLVTAIGIITANIMCAGERFQGNKDPKPIVIDEFAGYFVTIIGLGGTFLEFAIALICFRLFDITKPFFIRRVEKFPRGYGIVLDDVLAGIYALCLTRLLLIYALPYLK